jgi:hypothetical protein
MELKNPYVGPRTYTREESHLLFGRDREGRDLARLVATERIVLFYAQSGAGKSSLIQARLIPLLEQDEFEVLPIGRLSGGQQESGPVDNIYIHNLVASLIRQELAAGTANSLTLTHFIGGLHREGDGYLFRDDLQPTSLQQEEQLRQQVLIIDQFEELFSTHAESWQKRADFFHQVAEAIEDHPTLRIMLAMRQDFIGLLDPYVSHLPNRLRARYPMNPLEREAALAVVKRPVEALRPFAPGVAEKLVDDLSSIRVLKPDGTYERETGQYVEPSQIQVVCYSLWETLPAGSLTITEQDLNRVGDVNQSLGEFYAQRVRQAAQRGAASERQIRTWFEKYLITPERSRTIVVQDASELVGGLPPQVVRGLSELVRAERRGGVVFYELSHDRLVDPILENNRKWYAEHSSPLQRQASLWDSERRAESFLLSGQALEELEKWADRNPDEITGLEKSFLETSRIHQTVVAQHSSARRDRQLRAVIAGLILLTIVAFFIGYYLGLTLTK